MSKAKYKLSYNFQRFALTGYKLKLTGLVPDQPKISLTEEILQVRNKHKKTPLT
jgi:hypothetical protein